MSTSSLDDVRIHSISSTSLVPDRRAFRRIGSRTGRIWSPFRLSSSRGSSRSWCFFDVATGHQTSFPLYTWLTSGILDIHIGFSIDRLTAVMLLLVTTVSTLVHIYTIGYMQRRTGLCPLLHLYRPVHLLDADVGHGGQPAATLHFLGSRRALFLSAHRPLV